jgi:FtsH-binding integral membrane protein
MAEFDRPTIAAQRAGTAAAIDEGLRSYMLKVYNYMGIGLVVTGARRLVLEPGRRVQW